MIRSVRLFVSKFESTNFSTVSSPYTPCFNTTLRPQLHCSSICQVSYKIFGCLEETFAGSSYFQYLTDLLLLSHDEIDYSIAYRNNSLSQFSTFIGGRAAMKHVLCSLCSNLTDACNKEQIVSKSSVIPLGDSTRCYLSTISCLPSVTGMPGLPEPLIGSISHKNSLCVAIAAKKMTYGCDKECNGEDVERGLLHSGDAQQGANIESVGVDIEFCGKEDQIHTTLVNSTFSKPSQSRKSLEDRILTSQERLYLTQFLDDCGGSGGNCLLSGVQRPFAVLCLFSMKEALYKALVPLIQHIRQSQSTDIVKGAQAESSKINISMKDVAVYPDHTNRWSFSILDVPELTDFTFVSCTNSTHVHDPCSIDSKGVHVQDKDSSKRIYYNASWDPVYHDGGVYWMCCVRCWGSVGTIVATS